MGELVKERLTGEVEERHRRGIDEVSGPLCIIHCIGIARAEGMQLFSS